MLGRAFPQGQWVGSDQWGKRAQAPVTNPSEGGRDSLRVLSKTVAGALASREGQPPL